MSKSKVIPAVCYLRMSSDKQFDSIPAQTEAIGKLAKDRYDIVGTFKDEGIPGYRQGEDRPDFTRMLENVKQLGAHAVLCYDLSRFTRANFFEASEQANTLRKAGVRYIATHLRGDYILD